MDHLQWIMSGGGPLICVEKQAAGLWAGISGLTVQSADAKHDYDRACAISTYLATVPLKEGRALIVGDAPLDTAFWRSEAGQLFVLRIWFCEQDFDGDALMRSLAPDIFNEPTETLEYCFTIPDLILFDSAEHGSDPPRSSVTTSIESGPYRILTQPYDPDPSCSLVLHRFDRIA